jgi:thioredoxin 1
MGKAIEITSENFEEVINSDKPVLVDFWAEWCGPCKMIGPIVEEIAGETEGSAVVAKLNVDNESQLAQKYGVRSIPTLLFFKNGKVVGKHIGFAQKKVLTEKLNAAAEVQV